MGNIVWALLQEVGRRFFLSPISAPFGGFTFISEDVRLQYLEEAIRLMVQWAIRKEFVSIVITLPPLLYSGSFIAKQLNCLWRQGFEVSKIDLNYSFALEDFDDQYLERIWYNARKNLRISMNAGLEFSECINDGDKEWAYEIIKQNRESKGFPMHMTWQQIRDTVNIIESDFFLVTDNRKATVASSIVFHVNKSVVQVIYWGDIQGHSEMKPMNFLSYKVFEFYKYSDIKVVDVGPSTEHSVPNYGLCEFKEGIGCRIDPKYTLIKKLG